MKHLLNRKEPNCYFGGSSFRPKYPFWFVEIWHRWKYRQMYAMLDEHSRRFYPISYAVSIQLQNLKFKLDCQAKDVEDNQRLRNRVNELERQGIKERLMLATAGFNEDQVDAFMRKFFVLPNETDLHGD